MKPSSLLKQKDIDTYRLEYNKSIQKQQALHPIPSQHLQQYKKIVGNIQGTQYSPFNNLFLSNEIYYHPTWFVPSFKFEVLEILHFEKIFTIKAHFSYFTLHLHVYDSSQSEEIHLYLKLIGKGSFGSVYQLNQTEVIKIMLFDQKIYDQRQKAIKKAFEEYCLFKLASVINVGPKLTYSLGFDILLCSNCIMFSMEKCTVPQQIKSTNLLKLLKKLHQVHIVHGDIKQSNIMYSPSNKNDVLIDFNCSSVVRQNIGFKSLTNFKGSLKYCSDKMRQIYFNKKADYVDLFYNDVYYLSRTQQQFTFPASNYSQKSLPNSILAEPIFNLCYHMKLRRLIEQKQNKKIMDFLHELSIMLVPSLKLTGLMKTKVTTSNFQIKKMYQNVYDKIISNIHQTLKIVQVLGKTHIESEVILLLRQTMDKYIQNLQLQIQYKFTFNKHVKWVQKLCGYQYEQLKVGRQSFCLLDNVIKKDQQINKNKLSNYRFNYLLRQMGKLDTSFLIFKRCYRQILQVTNDLNLLQKVFQVVCLKFNFNFRYPTKNIQNLALVNKIVNRYEQRKATIWRKAEINRKKTSKPFIFLLIQKICSIHEINTICICNSQIDIENLLSLQQQLDVCEYPQKKFKLIPNLVFRLIKSCESIEIARNQIKKLQKYFSKIVLYMNLNDQQTKSQALYFKEFTIQLEQMMLNISTNFMNSYGRKYLSQNKNICRSIKSQYFHQCCWKIAYQNKDIDKSLSDLAKLQINQLKCIRYLQEIIYYQQSYNLRQSVQNKSVSTLQCLLLIYRNYYCQFNLDEINHFLKASLIGINKHVVEYMIQLGYAFVDIKNMIEVLCLWLQNQIQYGYNCLQFVNIAVKIYILYQKQNFIKKDQDYKQVHNNLMGIVLKILQDFDFYYCFCKYQTFGPFAEALLFQLALKLSSNSNRNIINIIIDRLILQWVESFPQLIKYTNFLTFNDKSQQKLFKIFKIFQSASRSYEKGTSNTRSWGHFLLNQDLGIEVQIKKGYSQIPYIKQYQQIIKKQIKQCSNFIIIKLLVDILRLVTLYNDYKMDKQFSLYLLKLIQYMLINILKRINISKLAIRKIAYRKLPQVLRKIFKITHIVQQLKPQGLYQKKRILIINSNLKVSWYYLNLLCFRQSYIQNDYQRKIIMKKVRKNKIVCQYIKRKLMTLLLRTSIGKQNQTKIRFLKS